MSDINRIAEIIANSLLEDNTTENLYSSLSKEDIEYIFSDFNTFDLILKTAGSLFLGKLAMRCICQDKNRPLNDYSNPIKPLTNSEPFNLADILTPTKYLILNKLAIINKSEYMLLKDILK